MFSSQVPTSINSAAYSVLGLANRPQQRTTAPSCRQSYHPQTHDSRIVDSTGSTWNSSRQHGSRAIILRYAFTWPTEMGSALTSCVLPRLGTIGKLKMSMRKHRRLDPRWLLHETAPRSDVTRTRQVCLFIKQNMNVQCVNPFDSVSPAPGAELAELCCNFLRQHHQLPD
jgi:hypothetical protein